MSKLFLQRLLKIEGTVAAFAFVLAAGAVLADVIGREVFHQGIWGSAKTAVFCAVAAGFLGIGLATHEGMHLRPQFADGWIPERFEPVMCRLAPLITAALFFTAAYYAALYVYETYEYDQAAPVLGWPLWRVQIIMPYAFASNGIRNLIYAIHPDLAPKPAGFV